MDLKTQEILASLGEHKQIMVEQLHQFCCLNSGTDNLDGLKAMHRLLATTFKPIACQLETISFPPINLVSMEGELTSQLCGDALLIRKRPELTRRVLLMGHMDTVYPKTSAFQSLKYFSDDHLNGPGVTDMKGGLIVILHALQAFEQTNIASSIGWDVLINADEEIGSPASSNLFKEIAPNYQAALVYEPAIDLQGNLAKNRKGSGKFTLIATGKAAHAGRDFDKGRNAICYLAQAISLIHALNGKHEGITINVGKIAGGHALNIVPDKAVAKLDIRITHPQDEKWVREQLSLLMSKLKHSDYTLTLHGSFDRPVKQITPQTTRLFERICAINSHLRWQDSGGCCDGNNLAEQGLPVIDTLGVCGGHIHSTDEYIVLDSLVERASLSTLLLLDLAKSLEELYS